MMIYLSLQIIFSVCLELFINTQLCLGLSCKDENDKDVDWFIIYKLPKNDEEKSGNDNLKKGTAYAYITSEDPNKFKMSSNGIDDKKSMMAKTWDELISVKEKKQDTAYLLYNDGEPKGADEGTTSVGHLKGMVAFDKTDGIWLTHSIPKCCEADKYEYPKTATTYGQTAMCMTLKESSFEDISHHLLYCSPNVYDYDISKEKKSSLEKNIQSLFSDKPDFIKDKPYERITNLTSKGGESLTIFAKNDNLKEDIYSYLLAKKLDANLIAETWVNGQGGVLDPTCDTEKKVVDVTSLKLDEAEFEATEDHSKWAISTDSSKPWVCIGDLNRMKSQAKRGGGAVCFKSKPVRDAFEEIIDKKKEC